MFGSFLPVEISELTRWFSGAIIPGEGTSDRPEGPSVFYGVFPSFWDWEGRAFFYSGLTLLAGSASFLLSLVLRERGAAHTVASGAQAVCSGRKQVIAVQWHNSHRCQSQHTLRVEP